METEFVTGIAGVFVTGIDAAFETIRAGLKAARARDGGCARSAAIERTTAESKED